MGEGGAPVEQVLMFPSGTVALSSAGPILRVWDIVAGGRCTRALSNHQKTVTALAFNASASRLLSGGLDQMVKVYDVSTYKVVHTVRYPAPILCLAISVRSLLVTRDLIVDFHEARRNTYSGWYVRWHALCTSEATKTLRGGRP